MFRLLLVEDSPADALLMQKVFENAETPCVVQVAEDGECVLDILGDELNGALGDLPDIILLDMNLPRKSGLEVLRHIKSHETIRHIPVIMLSGSHSSADVRAAYHAYVCSYVVKPASVDEYKAFLYAFEAYWFKVAILPS